MPACSWQAVAVQPDPPYQPASTREFPPPHIHTQQPHPPNTQAEDLLREAMLLQSALERGVPAAVLERLLPKRYKQYQKGAPCSPCRKRCWLQPWLVADDVPALPLPCRHQRTRVNKHKFSTKHELPGALDPVTMDSHDAAGTSALRGRLLCPNRYTRAVCWKNDSKTRFP